MTTRFCQIELVFISFTADSREPSTCRFSVYTFSVQLAFQTRLCFIYSAIQYLLSINPKLAQRTALVNICFNSILRSVVELIFRKEAISQPWLVFMDPLSWSNWNFVILGFVEGGKPENPEKSLEAWRKPSANSTPGQNPTWATLAGGECSQRRCAITALHIHCFIEMLKKLLPVIDILHLMFSLFDFISGCS